MTATETPIHCFEKSGLGRAPFRCVGVASIPSASLAGSNPDAYNAAMRELPRDLSCGSCNYCGMAIVHNFIIKSADDRRFVVGSDCVGRTGDAGLVKAVRTEKARILREARTAKRALKGEARRAAWKVERDERAASFRVEYADLIKRAEPFMTEGSFIADVIDRHLSGCFVSDKALAAVERTIADRVRTDALRIASRHTGVIGKRDTFKVTVERVATFERPSFSRPGHTETVYITTMRDERGNAIVSKTPSFAGEKGETLTIKATVKEHSDYRGEQQTIVQRIKVLEQTNG